MSDDQFPAIGWLQVADFCKQSEIIDKDCPASVVDRAFIAANYSVDDKNKETNGLRRHEFLEILVRVADVKYRQSKQVSTFADALEKLLHECVFANYLPAAWQEFRDRELWTVEVNDVLAANREILDKLWAKLNENRGVTGRSAFDKMIRMATKDSLLFMTDPDAYRCFGMSKMTVKNELEKEAALNPLKYNLMKPPEFYEYIGRLASAKFEGNHSLSLPKKIEKTMDLIFPHYGFTRVPVGEIEDAIVESSEDSVIFEDVDTAQILLEQFH